MTKIQERAEKLHKEFDQRNVGIDKDWYNKRVRELAVFARQWANMNDIPILLDRARAVDPNLRAMERLLLTVAKDRNTLAAIYAAILDLGIYLQVLAEGRMMADVERKSRDASAT